MPVGETIPGGIILRPGEGPAPFVCTDCELRQREGHVALLPGQVIEVEDDGDWKPALLVGAGEPLDAAVVKDSWVEAAESRRDVAFVRVLSWEGDQAVPYRRIRPPR